MVENNPKIESFYRLNLLVWLGLETVASKSAEDALKLLEKSSQDIKLIIVRSSIKKNPTAASLVKGLSSLGLSIPVIVVGPGSNFGEIAAHVTNSLQLKILIQAAAKALNITAKDMSEKPVPDFYPIPIDYFRSLKRSVCNVFIKNGEKFELRFAKYKDFETQAIELLIQAQTRQLFIDKFDRLEFVNNLTSELMSTLESEELSEDEGLSAADKSVELLSKKLVNMGITEETIQLANKNIATMVKHTKTHPKLGKLLDKLLSNKTSYLYRHTQILTYIGLHIVKNIDWGNAEQEEKISFISFFHDIVLETDTQAMIKSTAELKKAELTSAERQLVEKHAQMAAELAAKFPHAPMGADQIIRQHHGTLNGIGFSEHYGNNVSPVAVVFIIAEEFTRLVMASDTRPLDKATLIRELKSEFTTSRFQKVIDLLQTITV